ncbi:hypothetical protein [Streptomyces sp. BRA346]
MRSILPLLREAVGRGVRVTVFIRDGTDPGPSECGRCGGTSI